jgi:tripeptide aminopeptidase
LTSLNQTAAVKRVMDLIAIPGGSGSEASVAHWISQQIQQAGLPPESILTDTAHRKSPAGGDSGNLIIRLKGTRRGPRRLLMAHMDTVPLAVGAVPVLDGDWIRPKSPNTALGGDNRAGCAVVLTAILEILQQHADYPPLTLLFTVQEEIGLRGAKFLNTSKLGRPELCFNWDGRDPASLVIGAVGASNLAIRINGIASHAGAHPERGVNAAIVAATALASLRKSGWHGLVRKGRSRGASNVGVIRGGDATNVVMPLVELEAEARSHDSDFRQRIVAAWNDAFTTAANSITNAEGLAGSLEFHEEIRYEPFRIDPASPCVHAAQQAVRNAKLEPLLQICDGGLDANWMAVHGCPTVTLGCGQHEIHTVKERLNVPQYLDACRIAIHAALA